MAPMAVELNLPGEQEQKEPELEQEELEEPEQEVPEMATATSSLVSAAGPSDKMESDTKVVVDATPVTLQEEAAAVPIEDIKVDDEPKPKTIGAEVAALLEEVEADTAAESVLRNKVEKDIEKDDVRRGSTFLTEIDDHEEVGPEVVSIVDKILSESTTETDNASRSRDDVQKRVEVVEPEFIEVKVQPLGTILDVDTSDSKQESSAIEGTGKENPIESTDNNVKNVNTESLSEANKKDEIKQTKDQVPEPQEKMSSEPTHVDTSDNQHTLPRSSETEIETIGTIENLKSEVNALLAPLSKEDDIPEGENKEEVIDISVVKESKPDEKTSTVLETATKGAEEELEEAMSEIPEMSSSVSVHDMLEDSDTQEVAEEANVEKKAEGALIDVSVIEESENNEMNIADAIQQAKEAFVAEVIPDDADIQVETVDGEEVVELTLESKDAIPLGAIAVATFAIFLALIFYYN